MEKHLILLLLSLLFKSGQGFENCNANIAIVGGGIAGTSASHFMSELFGDDIKIDLYTPKNIGGRLATINVDGREYEAGGSIIHPRNRYMQQFTNMLGLEHESEGHESVGVWNGDEFVYRSSEWNIVSMAKLIYRYGLQPFKLQRYISSILTDFERIYDLQESGKSFLNVTALLAAMNENFPKMLQTSMKAHFLEQGYSETFIEELMKATVIVNYGQDTNIHSFVGCVSLAAVGSDLWSVKGGNKKVPEGLIHRNKKVNVVPLRVTKIVKAKTENDKNSYEIYCSDENGSESFKAAYDIVVLATPLTHDQKFSVKFEGFPSDDFVFNGSYHSTVATFVKADMNPKYFNLDEDIDAVLSCNPNKTIVSSIGRLHCVEGASKADRRIWKIFSNAPLSREIINKMFLNVDEVKEINWKAYPQYSLNVPSDKFKLHNGLYHINAIEWAASAMEMSAIGGRNVALLAYEDFTRRCNLKQSINDQKPVRPHTVEL